MSTLALPSGNHLTSHSTMRPATRATSRRGTGLRLTRRGRLVVVVLVTLLAVAALLVGHGTVDASTTPGGSAALRTVVVEPGETLWQISHRVAPHADPRDTVLRIEELNALAGPVVRPGQQLLVPAAG